MFKYHTCWSCWVGGFVIVWLKWSSICRITILSVCLIIFSTYSLSFKTITCCRVLKILNRVSLVCLFGMLVFFRISFSLNNFVSNLPCHLEISSTFFVFFLAQFDNFASEMIKRYFLFNNFKIFIRNNFFYFFVRIRKIYLIN